MNEGNLKWVRCYICNRLTLSRKDEMTSFYYGNRKQGKYFPEYSVNKSYVHKECSYLDEALKITRKSKRRKVLVLIVMFGSRKNFNGR